MTEKTSGGIQSVVNALKVLEKVGDLQPVGVSELARQLELPKSTVQRALSTLGHSGWIHHSSNDQTHWQLTARMLSLSLRAFAEYSLKDLADEAMRDLNERTGETIHLTAINESTLADSTAIVIHRVDSTHAVRTFVPIGTVTPLTATAAGQAVLSRLSEDDLTNVLKSGLTPYTENTVTEPNALIERLQRARELGYTTNHTEWRFEVCAVAAPIINASGDVAGAMTISIPASRFDETRVPEYGNWVSSLASSIRPISTQDI